MEKRKRQPNGAQQTKNYHHQTKTLLGLPQINNKSPILKKQLVEAI
jgi:hypothetical protein